jgi:hypothetical protein
MQYDESDAGIYDTSGGNSSTLGNSGVSSSGVENIGAEPNTDVDSGVDASIGYFTRTPMLYTRQSSEDRGMNPLNSGSKNDTGKSYAGENEGLEPDDGGVSSDSAYVSASTHFSANYTGTGANQRFNTANEGSFGQSAVTENFSTGSSNNSGINSGNSYAGGRGGGFRGGGNVGGTNNVGRSMNNFNSFGGRGNYGHGGRGGPGFGGQSSSFGKTTW